MQIYRVSLKNNKASVVILNTINDDDNNYYVGDNNETKTISKNIIGQILTHENEQITYLIP